MGKISVLLISVPLMIAAIVCLLFSNRIDTIVKGDKKVKKVNTSKPGQYRITYQLEDPIGRKAKVTVTHRVLEKPGQQKGPSENGSDPADQPGKYLPPVPTPPVDTPVSEKMVQS